MRLSDVSEEIAASFRVEVVKRDVVSDELAYKFWL
jgi:hypothetical protein